MTDYATIAEVKAQIERTSTTSDTVLSALVTAASRWVDKWTNQPENYYVADVAASARTFTGSGGPVQRIDDCVAITVVAVKDSVSDAAYTTWAAGDYIAFRGDRRNPEFNQTPYNALMVDITGGQSHFTSGWQGGRTYQDIIFGAPVVYANFRVGYNPRQAHGLPTVQITARWGGYATVPDAIKEATIAQSSRWYKRGQSSWDDTLASGELGSMIFRLELDPDIKLMLAYYRRPSVGRK